MEIFERYIEADASGRKEQFQQWLASLKDPAQARRAISPDLDYSSLLQLRPFLFPAGLNAPKDKPRLAVLGGPTTSQLVRLLEVFLAGESLDCEIYEGGFGLYRQELLAPDSALDRFRPQIVFIAADWRDVEVPPAGSRASGDELVAREAERWAALWETARKRWGAAVIQNTFAVEPWGTLGHYGLTREGSPEDFISRLNLAFGRSAPSFVSLHSLPALAQQAGSAAWFDSRFYLQAKMPCPPECLPAYAQSVMSVVRAILGRSKKVLALDLDNTLWGGAVGDAGPEGVQIGPGSPEGEAFLRIQRHVKALRERGVLLAVCSKNDEDKAREAFRYRPGMPLELSDFACFIANWRTKASGLRAAAASLRVGLDSFVFVDDDPAERALVRRLLPEVAVPDMPEDPAFFVEALAKHRFFETASLTMEDSTRARYYKEEAERTAAAADCADLESFLASLRMRASIEPINAGNLSRAAQLVNKTNQFNLTGRRRAESELRRLAESEQWRTFAISLSDRIGDNGLIAVVLAARKGDALDIDTWLMSCRVLQRGVERWTLNRLAAAAREAGCKRLLGSFVPSGRNGLVGELYSSLGFRLAGKEGDATLWELALDGSCAPLSTFIEDGTASCA